MKNLLGLVKLIIMASMILFLTSCQEENEPQQIVPELVQDVEGCAQKGPFISGSSITVYDLQSDLSPSGKSYNSEITDNRGTFQLTGLALSSSFVRLRADGFYFNEVMGQPSSAPITLYALSDITNQSQVNINLLTHLEKPRVEFLMGSGQSFEDSKAKAQKEVLAIFNIDKQNIKTSEKLSISENGEDNAILLAVSSILQGYRSESEMTELVSNIRNDLFTDGILSSDTLGSELINQAISLDTVSIRNNLLKRYKAIGATAKIPDFGKYVANFIAKTNFEITKSVIDYPKTGINGPNLLSLNDSIYSGGQFSLAANIPTGIQLKVVITALDEGGVWFYSLGTGINWSISTFTGNSQIFTAVNPGTCDLQVRNISRGRYLIEYFETSSKTPTRKKTIRL